jgi:hypothetical protein
MVWIVPILWRDGVVVIGHLVRTKQASRAALNKTKCSTFWYGRRDHLVVFSLCRRLHLVMCLFVDEQKDIEDSPSRNREVWICMNEMAISTVFMMWKQVVVGIESKSFL